MLRREPFREQCRGLHPDRSSSRKLPGMIFDELDSLEAARTRIKVIGVGGAGKNAIDHMIENDVQGVEFIAVNTDAQDLKYCKARKRLLIGKNTTRGHGAGANPDVGRMAALESEDDIREMISDADMVFITCGMGGGTGQVHSTQFLLFRDLPQ